MVKKETKLQSKNNYVIKYTKLRGERRVNNQDVKKGLEHLKTNGVRITPQRHAILTYLYQTMNHPTADEIYKALEGKFPNMSVATVYNNLRTFKDAGLINELSFGDNSSRFDANMVHHYHIICRNCNKIEDFNYNCFTDLEKYVEQNSGFCVESHCVEIYGVCKDCQ